MWNIFLVYTIYFGPSDRSAISLLNNLVHRVTDGYLYIKSLWVRVSKCKKYTTHKCNKSHKGSSLTTFLVPVFQNYKRFWEFRYYKQCQMLLNKIYIDRNMYFFLFLATEVWNMFFQAIVFGQRPRMCGHLLSVPMWTEEASLYTIC